MDQSRGRFELITNPGERTHLATLYRDITNAGFGVEHPINWFTSMASRVDLLEMGWSVVKATLVDGVLPATLKQMIALTVSAQNHSRYCTVAHTSALQNLGLDAKVIEACTQNDDLDGVPPGQRAILKFARKCAKSPRTVEDTDFEDLYDGGLSEAEVMEVVMIALTTNFVNGWADATRIAVDVGNK